MIANKFHGCNKVKQFPPQIFALWLKANLHLLSRVSLKLFTSNINYYVLPYQKNNNNNKEDIKQNEIIHKPKGGVQALLYKFDDN